MNLDGCTLGLDLASTQFHQGELLKVHAVIKGGEYDQVCTSRKIEFYEYWAELVRYDDGGSYTNHIEKLRKRDQEKEEFIIQAGQTYHMDFEYPMRPNCRIHGNGEGWRLLFKVYLKGCVDSHHRFELDVQPARKMLAVVDALIEELELREVKRKRDRHDVDKSIQFYFEPSSALAKKLDAIQLSLLQNDDGGLDCKVVFDLTERSLKDYVGRLMGHDKVERRFVLIAEQIYSEQGMVNSEEIIDAFIEEMHGVIAERNNKN